MKTVTIEIPESLYADYEDCARERNIKPERMIELALQLHRARMRIGTRSLCDRKPVSLGKILKPWSSRAELLEDFFDREESDDRD